MDAELLALESAFRSLQVGFVALPRCFVPLLFNPHTHTHTHKEQESAVKLSEANCVELISKLVNRGRLKLIYTLDGSEYVTEHHLGV